MGAVKRTSSCNMVFLLFAVVLAAIAVAIPRVRHRIWFREDFSIAKERVEESRIADPMKKFLIVMLPDGTIVMPRVAAQV